MPTAKKYYTFNETINKTGIAPITSEEAAMAYFADEGNYITINVIGYERHLLPILMDDSESVTFFVFSSTNKPLNLEDQSSVDFAYLEGDGVVAVDELSGGSFEITEIGANMRGWVAANTTTNGLEIPIESPNGVKLLLEGKLCTENVSVVPKLTEQAVTPTTEPQTIFAPEGFAGFRKFTVNRIPSDYVPDGYVPEGTIPDGYVKPEGEVVLTENVTNMDISTKATLTTNIPIYEEYEGEVIIDG
jgi:hypothetical protein